MALKEHSTEVDALYNKIIELESRIEGQEQYSRRTSLHFHNIKVPVDERGNAKHPVNTYELILNVCNKGNNKITELRTILQRESKNS